MRKRITIVTVLLALGLASVAAAAEPASKFWVMPTLGFRSAGSFRIMSPDLAYTSIRFCDGVTYGLSFGYRFTQDLAVEAMWSSQKAGVTGTIPGDEVNPSQEVELYDVREDQIQANLLLSPGYRLGPLDPYLLFGAGLTSFNPDSDLPSKTRWAWSVGLGVQAMFGRRLGLRIQGKFVPTYISTADQIWEGGMEVEAVRNQMVQWEFQAGLVFRF